MAKFGIEITGIDEVVASLDRLPKVLAVKAYQPAFEAADAILTPTISAATPVQGLEEFEQRFAGEMERLGREGYGSDAWRARQPGGYLKSPGALRAAVKSKIENDTGGRGGQVTVDWGDYSWIARLVEKGHRNVRGGYYHINPKTGHVSGKGHIIGQIPPHPFARKATAACSEEVVGAFFTGLKSVIEKIGDF